MKGDVAANGLSLHVVKRGEEKTIDCICAIGKRYVEGEWPDHGWTFYAGQCCDCMNICVNRPAGGAIHICDLEAFIEALQEIQRLKS